MKIGDIELTTTEEELTEIAAALQVEIEEVVKDIDFQPLAHTVADWTGGTHKQKVLLFTGFLLGAQVYQRRMAEKATA